jgi:hypothetical protein
MEQLGSCFGSAADPPSPRLAYSELPHKYLRWMCEAQGLERRGNKAELVERLVVSSETE